MRIAAVKWLLPCLCCGAALFAWEARALAEARYRPGELELIQAVELMGQEECESAIPLLRRSWQVGRVRNALWNLGECYAHVNRPGQAIEAYNDYLEHPTTTQRPGDQAQARAEIARLEASVATVSVACGVSGASVTIDGHPVGETPLEALVGEGLHVVAVSSAGFATWRREIQVTAGVARELRAVLELLPGELAVSSEPAGAALEIDGESVGTTPWTKAISSGGHSLRLSLPGHRDELRHVVLQPGKRTTVAVGLERAHGTLNVETDALDARLLVDGEERAAAPIRPVVLEPGRYALEVTAPGRAPWTDEAEVIDGRTTEVELQLASVEGLHQAWFWTSAATTLLSFVAGTALLVAARNESQRFEEEASAIASGGEGTRDLAQRQADGEELAASARGLTVGGSVLLGVGTLAAVATFVLGFRTRFRAEASTGEIRTVEGELELEAAP